MRGIELSLKEGFNHISFPLHQQMKFRAGDMIGFQYSDNGSKAVISFDHWTCEIGVRCYSEEIFISNDSLNSFMSTTTRLTQSEGQETHNRNFLRFVVSSHSSLFLKIMPIAWRQGEFLCLPWISFFRLCLPVFCLSLCLPLSISVSISLYVCISLCRSPFLSFCQTHTMMATPQQDAVHTPKLLGLQSTHQNY